MTSTAGDQMDLMTRDEWLRYNRPSPRYTSYPTIPHWDRALDPKAVQSATQKVTEPAQVYVHIPFCEKQCLYCGCTMVVSQKKTMGPKYIEQLRRQVEEVDLRKPLQVQRIHLGGGTPTWLTAAGAPLRA